MNQEPRRAARRRGLERALLAALLAGGLLGGCAVVIGGAAVSGVGMAVDRRSTGTQVDDQAIELRASVVLDEGVAKRGGRVSATSYGRVVLLTGQAPTEVDRTDAENAVRRIDNVRGIVNELTVGPNAPASEIANDAVVTGRVKAAFFEAPDLQVASIKVVTERGIVYLMGRVTEAESAAAANAARNVAGVAKVVKIFQIITPAELAAMPMPPYSTGAATPPAPASAPASEPAR